MALINTAEKSDTFPIKDDSQLVRILQGLIADENGASALYSRVIDSLKERDNYENKEIIARLQEIRNDELQHAGSLIECITSLEPNITQQYEKGVVGEEKI